MLLVEAGSNFTPNTYPSSLTDAGIVGTPDFDWKYVSDDKQKLGHDISTPRGKVIGGSSAVNGTVAIRARPSDFARWTARGIRMVIRRGAVDLQGTGEHAHGRRALAWAQWTPSDPQAIDGRTFAVVAGLRGSIPHQWSGCG